MSRRVGILFGDQDNPFWQEQIRWYRMFLPEFPFETRIFFPDPPRDANAQARLCATLMGRGFDALIVNPLDGAALATAAAEAGDTPLFDVGPKSDPVLASRVACYRPLTVCDFEEQGRLCARELTRAAKKRRRFACVSGPAAARQSAARVAGALAEARFRGAVQTRVERSDFTRAGGRAAMERLLPWQPDAVFCANDLMALGACDVLASRGLELPVGGVDLIPEALRAVADGRMTASVGPLGREIVRGVLEAVRSYFETGCIPSGFIAKNHLVTRTSLLPEQQTS
ncbi:sugar-binding domain protein [Pyramidobacter piscolens W5455]|uniref:Sugar-binding domain protein n=1 Tax=Pyramidobacter piscolens W5455 TaxID=352165 RepID=A0ABM9ZRY2_9BACT|nr:sugar ABC transporter substrate-binding protein [Pyramidobacter piscolens]EFB89645.1 sugar-binding domain protein [Pyramidobacter piscolens W5455]